MTWVARIAACALLSCTSVGLTAELPVKPAQTASASAIPLAHSALLSVDATPGPDSIALHVRRVRDQSIVGSGDVSVRVDGKPESITRAADGSYLLPSSALRGDGQHDVDVTVGHDGIREVLSGKIVLPESSPAGGVFHNKQVAWWILNVTIVLIAAFALSRRKG